MTIQLVPTIILFVAAVFAGGLGVLANAIVTQAFKWPGWLGLWAALTVSVFIMAIIKVSMSG
jgi:hypothetical protein